MNSTAIQSFKDRNVVVCGGAGFIGSHIADRFSDLGAKVTVVDGFLSNTGANRNHLESRKSSIELISKSIECCAEFTETLKAAHVIVDAMGWSRHLMAFDDPFYDLKLNVQSHLHLIQCLKSVNARAHVIFLGSRGQYGRPASTFIDETTPMNAEDVQGVNKTCAESLFRVLSKHADFCVTSLRFGNTYGTRQPVSGEDIGLIGGFCRDLLTKKQIEVYDGPRVRSVVYVKDLTDAVVRLAETAPSSFRPLNFGSHEIGVKELASTLVDVAGFGKLALKPMPEHIAAIEMGMAQMNSERINDTIGKIESTSLHESLKETLNYFREALI